MGAFRKGGDSIRRWLTAVAAVAVCGTFTLAALAADRVPAGVDRDSAPFRQTQTIGCVQGDGMLADFCVGTNGQVLALVNTGVGGGRWGAIRGAIQDSTAKIGCELRVFDEDGKSLHVWPLSFMASAINVGPDGLIYVAGEGKAAVIDQEGKVVCEAVAPQVRSLDDRKDELRKLAAEQLAQEKELYSQQLESLKTQLKQLEEAAKNAPPETQKSAGPAKRPQRRSGLVGTLVKLLVGSTEEDQLEEPQTVATAAETTESDDVEADEDEDDEAEEDEDKADDEDEAEDEAVEDEVEVFTIDELDATQQMDIVRQQIGAYEQMVKQYETKTVDDVVAEMTARANNVNAIAVGEKDVFIACSASQGYGYAIWRTDLRFESPVQVVDGLVGCCGQMDIQCCNGDIWVCENARHRVVRFDRDGKELDQFGERGRDGEGAAFSGCCNPMNLCFGKNGDLYVSESNGVVKRFTPDGKYLGLLGVAGVQPGCKNSAVGVAPDEGKMFYIDIQNSNVIVLSKDESAGEEPAVAPAPAAGKPRAGKVRSASKP